MTLKELAKRCGVSVSTVSRVVNGNNNHAASAAVANKIWQMVHETGYIPNSYAQGLKMGGTQKSPPKAISLACIFARTCDRESGQFFSELFRIIEQECAQNKCKVTGIFPAFEQKKTSSALKIQDVDGVIVMGRCSKNLLQNLKKQCKNIIFVGLNSLKDNSCDQVICDGYEAAKTAIKHLYQLGHTRIGYIGEQSEEARYRGYYDAMKELKLPIEYHHIFNTHQSIKGGYQSGIKLLQAAQHPTALFCANDITAIGVIKSLQENGVEIPKDMSVISIDNIEMSQYCSPMLTSINIPREDLGRFTVKILLDRIEGGHTTPIKIDIPFTLIKRESSAQFKNI
ncbi:LacI family transcriptional regulator [Hydrogenoanaerobacterium saccharovorans]|uniref:Transcriptional regulator, LacI family n=1 Tax=Hydrogenoanaerobacterium saccharovorans TaxID=474960 RepID=A0A1H7YUN0_9FIRM|nr:LacI family DNA-binding transcriptional regulator [Hydrogenoanaerobacterium saccharovorans]RPF49008.1 LacI family transcriptional regulator [Hydrogenoanaerobacterium saccharovorans]SEM49663.1 transcriptional regulator, LacI family [Hydrogenoanaerobacterium saccharovorans]